MSQNLPSDIREEIREVIYREADKVNYSAQDRTHNGEFMNRLVKDTRIGGVLRDFMDPGEVRTYIKDAVLNRYAKDRKNEALARITNEELLEESAGEVVLQGVQGKVSFFSTTAMPAQYYVISEGTCAKWETALRKALEYVAKLPAETQAKEPHIGLKCIAARGSLTASDKKQIRDALSKVEVEFYCIEF